MIRLAYDDLDKLNVEKCPGISTFNSLRHLLDDSTYPHTIEKISELTDNAIRFYPIQPISFDLAFSNTSPSIGEYIPSGTLAKLKNRNDNLCLLIFFAWEGFDLQFFDYLIPKFFNKLSRTYKIPPEKIFWVYGDINIKQNIKKLPFSLDIPDSNVIGYNIFEYVARHDSRTINFKLPTKDSKIRNKKFLYKNGVARSHRTYLAGALQHKNLLDKCFFSWLNHQKLDYDCHQGSYLTGIFKMYNSSNFQRDYFEGFKEIRKIEPVILDISQEEGFHRENQIYINEELYKDSYCSLVTESVFDDFSEGTLFFSEKIYQPIYNFHPFIVVGAPGILKTLREDGYMTFPELFDESYDTITDASKRMEAIITEIERFCSVPDEEHMRIINSDNFQRKLIYNWENFIKRSGKPLFDSFIRQLEIERINYL